MMSHRLAVRRTLSNVALLCLLALTSAAVVSAATITGTVTGADGRPVPNARLWLYRYVTQPKPVVDLLKEGKADKDGSFRFTDDAYESLEGNGTWTVYAYAPHMALDAQGTVDAAAPLEVKLVRAGYFLGKVVDAQGRPMEGVNASVFAGDSGKDGADARRIYVPDEVQIALSAVTDRQGRYALGLFPPGWTGGALMLLKVDALGTPWTLCLPRKDGGPVLAFGETPRERISTGTMRAEVTAAEPAIAGGALSVGVDLASSTGLHLFGVYNRAIEPRRVTVGPEPPILVELLVPDGSKPPGGPPSVRAWGHGDLLALQMPPAPGSYIIRATCDLGPFGKVVGQRGVSALGPEALARIMGLQQPQHGRPAGGTVRLDDVLRRDGGETSLKVDNLQVRSLTLVDQAGRPMASLDTAYYVGVGSGVTPDSPRGPALSLRDAQGRRRLVIAVRPTPPPGNSLPGSAASPDVASVPSIELIGEDGRPSAVLWVGPDGPELVLQDEKGMSRTRVSPEPTE